MNLGIFGSSHYIVHSTTKADSGWTEKARLCIRSWDFGEIRYYLAVCINFSEEGSYQADFSPAAVTRFFDVSMEPRGISTSHVLCSLDRFRVKFSSFPLC